MEEINTGVAIPAKRPTFLTVLCILSFIGIGFSLISGIRNYFEFSSAAVSGDLFGDMKTASGEDMGEAMNTMADAMGLNIDYGKMALNALVVAILNIPLLIGVLMMWKQRKMGFYVYTAVELIQCIMPFILVGGLVAGIMGIVMGIFAIVFIVLYGLNLKHMS